MSGGWNYSDFRLGFFFMDWRYWNLFDAMCIFHIFLLLLFTPLEIEGDCYIRSWIQSQDPTSTFIDGKQDILLLNV